jgi:actin-related protein
MLPSMKKERLNRVSVDVLSTKDYLLSSKLVDLVDLLKEALDKVPLKYQNEAYFELNIEENLDGHEVRVEARYYRPETEEEFQDRLRKIEEIEKDERERELRILASLKEKYESN